MQDFDFDCVAYDGEIYCTECLPDGVGPNDDDVSPIFAGAEVDSWPVCSACGAVHDYMALTSYGEAERERRAAFADYWPNLYMINDHGNVSLLFWDNGDEAQSWV